MPNLRIGLVTAASVAALTRCETALMSKYCCTIGERQAPVPATDDRGGAAGIQSCCQPRVRPASQQGGGLQEQRISRRIPQGQGSKGTRTNGKRKKETKKVKINSGQDRL